MFCKCGVLLNVYLHQPAAIQLFWIKLKMVKMHLLKMLTIVTIFHYLATGIL